MPAKKIFITLWFITATAMQSCVDNKDNQNTIVIAKQKIIATDQAFSDMSKSQGMKKAFIEYIDNEGVLLRPNHLPIIGADAIDFLSQDNDSGYTLSWKPYAADISASADLGYTYGIYELQLPDTILKGTYLSIWKKQADGNWKFVLDTGNEGLKDYQQSDSSAAE